MGRPSKHFNLNRRSFLQCSYTLAATSIFPQIIHADTDFSSEKTLEFVNLHTDETLQRSYWANDQYDVSSLEDINHILRDHRANEVYEIDVKLLNLLHHLHDITASKSPFHIISAYRSPLTNEKLRKQGNGQGNGVAKKSLHMQGKAIDIRLPDIALKDLRDAAISLNAGGVGYYASSNFIHIDIGKPRSW